MIQSRITLAEFVREEWWPRYAVPNLKLSTQRRYLEVWGTHLLPAPGDYELRAITPMLVEDPACAVRRTEGRRPDTAQGLMLLQGILRRAVVRGLIPVNPVAVVGKPRQPPTRRPEPLPPVIVERIRAQLPQRDAALISILAYAGLRPDEATSARWSDLSDRTLRVHESKTERARTIKLIQPLVQDLAEWRLASGRPPPTALIFRTHDGDAWKLHDWQNWRRPSISPPPGRRG